MRYAIRFIALIALIAGLAAGPAHAEKRVALVIGNGAYVHATALPNPTNDAGAMAAVLQRIGFEHVVLLKDLGADALRRALIEFERKAAGADIAVVYFAGHGIEVDGQNFLVPVDARLARAGAVELEAIPLSTVTAVLSGALKLRLVILDACRSNPFRARLAADATGGRKRSVGRGLVRIEPGENELIAFAAAAGTEADDGSGLHSPFTAALLKQIETPGLEIRLLFGGVRDDVLAATRRLQTPHVYGTLGREPIYLKAPPADAKSPVVPPPQPSPAALEWARVDKSSTAELETFVARHPASAEADYARARLRELRKAAAVTPPPPPKVVESAVSVAPDAALTPGRVFRDCPDCPEMVVLPAGSFMMGSPASEEGRGADEGPQRKVTIARPFAVGKFEVTFAEWDACAADGGCKHRPNDHGWGRGRRPVIDVSWHDAKEYAAWLSRKTGKSYRLLSEAEWEYAARAGTITPFSTGPTITTSEANFDGNYTYGGSAKGVYRAKTVAVGSFSANRFGLHDMHGNVWEWVENNWHPNYHGAPNDGSVWSGGDTSLRVLRGGSWVSNPQFLRSAVRFRDLPVYRLSDVGFRLARTLN